MSKIKLGFLGSGYIASVHAAILKQDARVEIIGVADLLREKAEALAKTIGAHAGVADNLDPLLELGVDTVYITTPNTTHVEPVVQCLNHDINVFSEKPMAIDRQGGWQILEAARASKATYNLGMNRRFAYTHKKIKSLIDDGRLEPYMAQFKLNRGELLEPAWTSDSAITGGFLYETTIHQLDLVQYLLGPIRSVRCEARQNISESEFDDFAILFTFDCGVIATMISSAHSGWSYPFERVEIYGRYSTVATEELDKVRFSPGLKERIELEEYTQVPFAEKGGYIEEDRLFIDALTSSTKPPVDVEQAYNLNLLLATVYESARENREINLSAITR